MLTSFMTRALVLQHIACEPPGEYEGVLVERGIEIHCVELDEGEPLPQPGSFGLIVAMGGPMSVNDEAEFPWLAGEKRLVASSVRSGVPFWGACLGVQLLAASLGAKVYAGSQPEVGLMTVDLTEEAVADPVFEGLPSELLTLQWHGDTFDLPDGAVRLAGSDLYPNQAFRFGRSAYGVQFHLEVSTSMAEEWARVPAYDKYLDRVLGPGSMPGLLEQFEQNEKQLREHAGSMFERWLNLFIGSSR
jgi:GMP synthase (glutamine-hydrolysing)